MDKFNLLLIQKLSEGFTQREVSELFKQLKIEPNSISIIEKRIKDLKITYNAKTNFQLAVIITQEKILKTKEG